MDKTLTESKKLTKAEIKKSATALADNMLKIHDPIEAFIRLKAMGDAVSQAMKAIEPMARGDLNDTKETLLGVTIQPTTRTNYDYSHDDTWQSLAAREKDARAQKVARQKFLQSLREPVADMETGEIVTPVEVKDYTVSLRVSFPK